MAQGREPRTESRGTKENPMSVSARQNPLQTYQLILYGRVLHPTHFQLKGRQVVAHNGYVLEAWVMPGQHALRFDYGDTHCTEHVTDQDKAIPTGGIVTQHLCASEKECEREFPEHVVYLSACQTETLPESIYAETYEEMLALGRENNALIHPWEDDVGRCLSMVDMQRYQHEAHAQCYHMIASAGLVLKTQSIFELRGLRARGMIEGKPANGAAAPRRNGR